MSDQHLHEDKAHWPPVPPVSNGLRGRCPRCGEGRMFAGALSLQPQCGVCGLDYSFADAGDGPAVFVILIVGFIVVGLALMVETSLSPPIWVHLILWLPLAIILSVWGLRLAKGVLVNLQYAHKAAEGRIDRE